MKYSRKNAVHSMRGFAETLMLLTAYVMTFVFSAQIKSGANNSLSLCAKVIIPSVFPVMVISNTLLMYGFPPFFTRTLSAVSKIFFGLSGNGAVCLLFGLTGGYPVGVKNARLMHSKNLVSTDEAKRICLVAVSPGLSFTISVCGAFFSSITAGATLFFACFAANTVMGFILKVIFGNTTAISETKTEKITLSDAFLSAVEKSTSSVLSVCSYIIVFSSATALLSACLPTNAAAPVRYIAEVTAGVQFASERNNIIAAAFLCGFGGVSVAMQLLPDIKALGIKARTFILCRFATGLLAAFFEFAAVSIFRLSFPATKVYTCRLFSNSFSGGVLLFGMALMLITSSLEGGIRFRNSAVSY